MRITELQNGSLQATDYLAVDDATMGTRKLLVDDVIEESKDGLVSYADAQTLTAEQQAQARTNIGVGSASTIVAGLVQLYDGIDSTSTTMAATAAAVKAAYDKSVKIYTSVTELGLTSGSATIAGCYAAMPNKTILISNSDEFAAGEKPENTGVVEIVRADSQPRGYVLFHEKTGNDYRMGLNSSNVPDGTWVKIPNGTRFLGSSTNLNDLRGSSATGFYEVGENVPNAPQNWCMLMVIGGLGTTQFAFVATKLYIRMYTGSPLAWTAWKSITLS